MAFFFCLQPAYSFPTVAQKLPTTLIFAYSSRDYVLKNAYSSRLQTAIGSKIPKSAYSPLETAYRNCLQSLQILYNIYARVCARVCVCAYAYAYVRMRMRNLYIIYYRAELRARKNEKSKKLQKPIDESKMWCYNQYSATDEGSEARRRAKKKKQKIKKRGKKKMSENLKICYECGRVIEENEECFAYDSERVYCQECTDDLFSYCERCESLEYRDDSAPVIVSYNGTTAQWCYYCVENYARCCYDCNEYFSDDLGITDRHGNGICPVCEDSYYYCEECNEYVHEDDYNHGNDICYHCQERMRHPRLKGYHGNYKNKKIGNTSKRWHGIWRGMGGEIEIDREDEDRHAERELIDELIKITGEDALVFETDGSLKHGFEIITQPHTIEAFKKIEWQKILDACKNYGYSAHNIGTCGLHLHFSREMFGSDTEKQTNSIAKLLYFFEHNHDNLLKASRRNAHELDRWARRYYIDNKDMALDVAKNGYNYGRYHTINLTNNHTVEIRIMRGTLNYNTFMACIDLLVCLVKKSRTIKWKNIDNVSEWLKYIDENTKQYLKSKNAFVEVL